jgi:hypothetical protein
MFTEPTMKRTASSHQKLPEPPRLWREAEYAARRINAENNFDDRVTEEIFDIEDERAEVDIITHRMSHDFN